MKMKSSTSTATFLGAVCNKGNEKKQEVTPDQVRVISLAYDKAKQSRGRRCKETS